MTSAGAGNGDLLCRLLYIIYLNGKVCNYEKDGQGFHIFCFVI